MKIYREPNGKISHIRSEVEFPFKLERRISAFYIFDPCCDHPFHDYFIRVPAGDKEVKIFFEPYHYQDVYVLDKLFSCCQEVPLVCEFDFYLGGPYIDGDLKVFVDYGRYKFLIEPCYSVNRALLEVSLFCPELLPEFATFFKEAGVSNG